MIPILEIGLKLLDRVLPDKGAREAAQLELLKLSQAGEFKQMDADLTLALGQIDTNKIEAANPNMFISGWRPFVGWVCGVGVGYSVLGQPILTFIAAQWGRPAAPAVDISTLVMLLLALLGMGTQRMFEKIQGVSSK